MDPQSLDLQGFPEARVEMKVAPFRALTRTVRLRSRVSNLIVEMKVAPFRALTQFSSLICESFVFSRNEGRPIQGIDTQLFQRVIVLFFA